MNTCYNLTLTLNFTELFNSFQVRTLDKTGMTKCDHLDDDNKAKGYAHNEAIKGMLLCPACAEEFKPKAAKAEPLIKGTSK